MVTRRDTEGKKAMMAGKATAEKKIKGARAAQEAVMLTVATAIPLAIPLAILLATLLSMREVVMVLVVVATREVVVAKVMKVIKRVGMGTALDIIVVDEDESIDKAPIQ